MAVNTAEEAATLNEAANNQGLIEILSWQKPITMKSKGTAAILAFFLGGLGVHRFYLGQAGLGVLYLLFCWTLIPAFVAFIDFIVFLATSEDSFNQKYNKPTMQPVINVVQNPPVHTSAGMHHVEQLERLSKLRDSGALSHDEFEAQKRKILA